MFRKLFLSQSIAILLIAILICRRRNCGKGKEIVSIFCPLRKKRARYPLLQYSVDSKYVRKVFLNLITSNSDFMLHL